MLTAVAVTAGVLLGTAGVAEAAVTRHYVAYNCYWEKAPYYEVGFFAGTTVRIYCPTSAPGTQYRARVTWHSHDYQYSTIQFNYINQGTGNSGVLYSDQGVVDEVTAFQFR
ncbi:hypothetical protein KRMM14A1004_33200 [Krasilnikovia sp. MM14-A1004]